MSAALAMLERLSAESRAGFVTLMQRASAAEVARLRADVQALLEGDPEAGRPLVDRLLTDAARRHGVELTASQLEILLQLVLEDPR